MLSICQRAVLLQYICVLQINPLLHVGMQILDRVQKLAPFVQYGDAESKDERSASS